MKKVLRNKWKRICATVLAAAMTVTMLPANAQAAASTKEAAGTQIVELVTNGDFKTGTDGWTIMPDWQGGGDVERVASGDDGYLKVSNRKTLASGASYDLTGKLNKKTEYTIRGKLKYDNADGPDTRVFNAAFQNGTGWEWRQVAGAITAKKGEWVSFEIKYTPTDVDRDGKTYEFSTEKNLFYIETGWASDPTAANDLMDYCIDDISITYQGIPDEPDVPEEPEEPEGETIIADGFENETKDPNWLPMGSAKAERVTDAAHEGNASLKISNYTQSWEGGRYELKALWSASKGEKLIPGKKYTLTSWVKTESGSDKISVNIKGSEGGGDKYDGIASANVNSTGWTRVSGEFTLREYDQEPQYLEIYWTWNKTGAPPAFYIDDVSLIMNTDNLVRNGSFEKDLEKWTANDAAEDANILSVATDEKHTGDKSVKVSNRTKSANGPAQDMKNKLTPGSIYMVSAWVKYKDGVDTRKFNLAMQGKEAASILASGTAAKGTWTEIKGVWFMPDDMDNQYASLYVETADSSDTADFYVDDVSILEYQDTTAALAKKFGYGNPITTNEFGADPYAIEYNGRVYVYMTADDYEFSDKDNPYSNNFGYITSLRVVSSADLMNWTDHGEIEVAGRNGGKGPAMWASHSWAPAIAYKKVNGKDKFFLYFANDASGIGVLEADTPLGPWRDPIGAALITKATPGCEKVEWCFDPAVLVDDNGSAYIYFGGGVPAGQSDNPKTARVAKLGADMISLEGAAVEIDAPCMFEDSGIFKAGNTYYYSYCSNFTQSTKPGYPGTGTICYMTSNNPMGPFTYQGEIFSNPSIWFGVGGNNHHATFTFKGKSYFIYHAQTVSKALGVERGYRSTHIDEIQLDENGKILEIAGTYKGISQLAPMNPYSRIEAETIAWNAGVKASVTDQPGNLFEGYNMVLTDLQEGDWTSVSQLDFGSEGSDKITVSAGSKDGGTIDVIVDHPEIGEKVGTIEVPATGSCDTYQLVTGTLTKKITGTRSIFLVFHEKKAGATTQDYKTKLQNLWEKVTSAEKSLPLIEQLKRQITKANNVKSGFAWNETDKTEAMQAKVNAANAVVSKGADATETEINTAMNELNELINLYDDYKATDNLLKEKLKYRIQYAEQLKAVEVLATEFKSGLQEAIDSANQLLKDDNIMNVDYFQFIGSDNGEKEQLKTQLSGQISEAQKVLAQLSDAEKAKLQTVIGKVNTLLTNGTATKEELQAAVNELTQAVEAAKKTIGSGSNTGADKPAVGQTFSADGLTYIVTAYDGNAMTVTVTGAEKQLTTLTIPATVTYKNSAFKVTAVGKQAFANQKSLKSVTIGENVTTIESGAFLNDTSLTNITFSGAGVQNIAADAFKGINKKASFGMKVKTFTSKNLKYSITKNTASAKEVTVTGTSSKKLTSLTVPATVKYNGMTFKVTAVNKKAFKNQKKLKSVTVGKNVTSIGNEAFSGAKKLAKIKFSGTAIKKIGKNAFKNIKKNATFSIKKSKKASLKKLLKKAGTKNYKVK